MRTLFLNIIVLFAVSGCGLDQSVHRSDAPLSRESAHKHLSLPFPDSANDIYYVVHAGGMQEYQLFVRFTVAPEDLDKTVDSLVSEYKNRTGGANALGRVSASEAPRSPEYKQLLPMPWWNPSAITNGYYRGSTERRPFHIWADVSQHVIFLCETD